MEWTLGATVPRILYLLLSRSLAESDAFSGSIFQLLFEIRKAMKFRLACEEFHRLGHPLLKGKEHENTIPCVDT